MCNITWDVQIHALKYETLVSDGILLNLAK